MITDSKLEGSELRLDSKRQLPKVPDLSGQLEQQRRANPFALDDFRGSTDANVTKP